MLYAATSTILSVMELTPSSRNHSIWNFSKSWWRRRKRQLFCNFFFVFLDECWKYSFLNEGKNIWEILRTIFYQDIDHINCDIMSQCFHSLSYLIPTIQPFNFNHLTSSIRLYLSQHSSGFYLFFERLFQYYMTHLNAWAFDFIFHNIVSFFNCFLKDYYMTHSNAPSSFIYFLFYPFLLFWTV